MKILFVRGCVLVAMYLVMSSFAFAQTLTGSITGQVTDARGAALAGVKVTAVSKALIGGSQSGVTDSSGSYTFNLLPPGAYDLKFEMQGFKSASRAGIEINAAFVATVNVSMEVGAMSETVTITSEAPVIDTRSNIQQTVLDQKLLENLPSGRDPWAVGRIVPGMQMGKFDVGGSNGMQQTGFTIHGSVANQSQYNIDGLTINWPGGNEGGSTALYYDQGMFQEVNFQTNALPAEVSVGGTYMNMVTKSGGNDFHGNVLFYYANENIQSDNFNKNSKFDRFRVIRPTLTGGNPLTRSYDLNGNIGGPIIKDRLWFFASFRQWGVDKRVLGARNPDGSFSIDDNRIVNVVGKGTWRMTENNTLSYMYNNNQKDRFHRRDTPPSFIEDQASWLQDQPGNSHHLGWTSTLSPRTILDAKLGFMMIVFPLRYQADVKPTDLTRTDSIRSTRTGAAPYNYENPTYRIQADVALSHTANWAGSHNLKVGEQFSRQFFRQTYNVNSDVNLNYQDGAARTITIYNTPLNQLNYLHTLGLYAQDAWTIKQRLTLNLGARFEYVVGSIPAQTSGAGTFVGARSFSEIKNVPNLKDIAPRLAFAYDLLGNGRTVIRGNYSRYFLQIGAGFVANVNPLIFDNLVTRSWTDRNNDNLPQESELGAPSRPFRALNQRMSNDLARPYSDEFTVGVQHELFRNFAVSATYYHRLNRRLFGQANQGAPTSAYTPLDITITNPDNLVPAKITIYNQPVITANDFLISNYDLLNSDYKGFEMTFVKRLSARWQMLGGFTAGRHAGRFNAFADDLNNPNLGLNRTGARIGDDATYQFKLAGSYTLPGGIEAHANYLHSTGYPLRRQLSVAGNILRDVQDRPIALRQGSQSIELVPRGNVRLEPVDILDLRFSRRIKLRESMSIEPVIELFNATNSSSITTSLDTYGFTPDAARPLTGAIVPTNVGLPTEVLGPRLLRLGVRFNF